ncbi:uncharacterized protein LOC114349936 [Ostrinia furnacalis]|uniref:uncharacterized protein LOC114349936 n=1 Tax=Ostrinia furnacalis TaxID=93504 RepID=UPI00103FAC98|nr:uncharacterized protein LOC114349936 [Ostrinia furnacalis]
MKCFVVMVFLSVIVYGCDEDYFRKLDAITPEEPCSRAGGICTFAEDCPLLTEESGLCPKQRSQGVECCYGVSVKDTRCQKHGGSCTPSNVRCGPTYANATDCATGEQCCIYV